MMRHGRLFNATGCIFLTLHDFCHLLLTFANSLDPNQDRVNVGPDLDPNCLNL